MEKMGIPKVLGAFTVAGILLPWGFTLMGADRNVAAGVGMVSVSSALLIYMVWAWEHIAKRHMALRLLLTLVVLAGVSIPSWKTLTSKSEKHDEPRPEASNPRPTPPATEAPAKIAEKVRPATPNKVPPPRSSTPIPLARGPRLGIGPEAYKDIEDAQVGQWAIEESDKIEELANTSMRPGPGSPSAAQWFFQNRFKDCCAEDVQELRTEILRRLGPPAKDPDEISAWTMLFPETKYAGAPEMINPMSVTRYAPYLRRLGLQLKRRQIPRHAPIALQFSEAQVAPQPPSNFPYNLMVTVKTETKTTAGYIIVEFDGHPASIACDFVDSKLVVGSDAAVVDNKEVREYAGKYDPPNYALAIGKTPFTPEKPVHVIASGSKLFHVAKVTLFDE